MRVLAIALAFTAFAIPSALGTYQSTLAINYLCGAEQRGGLVAGPVRMSPGMGTGGFAIATNQTAAQTWFSYGMKLYHGFYHDDAKAAFAQAVKLDPTCAMCVWGQALAAGSTFNYDITPKETAAALALADKAAALGADENEKNRALIAALQARYRAADVKAGDAAYVAALDALAARYPDDSDIVALTAHAALIPARNGDNSRVERKMALLEDALKRRPNDTAAIHFYIHASEFAGRAALALPYAERLPNLAPDASHLVHMAGHTMFRLGRYEDVAVVNAQAMEVDARNETNNGRRGDALGAPYYYGHNLMFGIAGALMSGDRALSLKYAEHAAVAFPSSFMAARREPVIAKSYIAFGRFDPDRALAIPAPAKSETRLRLMRHYARGEAFALRRDAGAVQREAQMIRKLEREVGGKPTTMIVARLVLEGRAAMLRGQSSRAISVYREAADLQDKELRGSDPPPWWYPVRRSLAAALFKAGQTEEAKREAEASLKRWPNDALALSVLAQAEAKLGSMDRAKEHEAQARAAWVGDPSTMPLDLI